MASNLPPGCSSADGGIDHVLETQLETLCDMITTVEMADELIQLVRDACPKCKSLNTFSNGASGTSTVGGFEVEQEADWQQCRDCGHCYDC